MILDISDKKERAGWLGYNPRIEIDNNASNIPLENPRGYSLTDILTRYLLILFSLSM